jgi:hypothetical protein
MKLVAVHVMTQLNLDMYSCMSPIVCSFYL